MKKYVIRFAAVMFALSLVLCSCSKKISVWPDGWVKEQKKNNSISSKKESALDKKSSQKAEVQEKSSATSSSESDDTSTDFDNFYPDLSRSAGSYEGIDKIYSLVRSAEGGSKLRYWGIEKGNKKLVEIDYKKIFGEKDFERSPLDCLIDSKDSCNPNGVNILVTDMMSCTGSEFGEWLVSTGSNSFSFYTFNLPFNGDIDFYSFPTASSEKITHYHVKKVVLNRDLLLVAFGSDKKVRQFDLSFINKIKEEEMAFDHSHISMSSANDSGFPLTPAPCFTENLPNITYESTNYIYGLSLIETKETTFTVIDTYVFTKSGYSANERQKAVRAVFYGVPDESLGNILKSNCQVMEYDSREKAWKDSAVTFKVSTAGSLKGLPASIDNKLNEKLGGNIVSDGKVFTVSIENSSLPKGLYALEISLVFEAAENTDDLRNFAKNHSAEISEYINVLNECTPAEDSTYLLNQNQKAPQALGKLIDFQGMIDELTASGFSDPDADNTYITLRMIIDNR